jgi:hypothetical protein
MDDGCMVVGFTTTYAISAYHHWRCELESCSWRGILDTTVCDEVSDFLLVFQFPPRYNWNIVKSGFKHHNPTPNSVMNDESHLYIISVTLCQFDIIWLCGLWQYWSAKMYQTLNKKSIHEFIHKNCPSNILIISTNPIHRTFWLNIISVSLREKFN